MTSYQISLTPAKRTAGRFVAAVRRELQKALAEEHAAHGVTQASLAADLGVNRSVIHRQIVGHENLTVSRIGEIAGALGREVVFALVKPDEDRNFFKGAETKSTPSIKLEQPTTSRSDNAVLAAIAAPRAT